MFFLCFFETLLSFELKYACRLLNNSNNYGENKKSNSKKSKVKYMMWKTTLEKNRQLLNVSSAFGLKG